MSMVINISIPLEKDYLTGRYPTKNETLVELLGIFEREWSDTFTLEFDTFVKAQTKRKIKK